MAGGSIETLREVLGHSSVVVTERYAPVSTDLFGQADLTRVVVDLSAPTGKILPTRDIGGTVSKQILRKPEWRNGIRSGLKIRRP